MASVCYHCSVGAFFLIILSVIPWNEGGRDFLHGPEYYLTDSDAGSTSPSNREEVKILLKDELERRDDWGGGGPSRSRRYVGDVIPSLADNYNPLLHRKNMDKDLINSGLESGLGIGGELRRGSRRMEMVGNVAVPVSPEITHSHNSERHQEATSREVPHSLHQEERSIITPPPPLHPTTAPKSTLPSLSLSSTTPGAVGESGNNTNSESKEKEDKPPPATKKPVDPLLSQKKAYVDPTNYKKVDSNGGNHTAEEELMDISTDNFSKDITNSTLRKNNIAKMELDHHVYYNSTFISNDSKVGMNFWVDMGKERDVVINDMLSQSYRRAATVRLSFDFPFYGHIVRNMTVATGGFLYTGDYIHSWLAATQYIAPLMANFDTSISGHSHIKYRDNGTSFTVEWDHVSLQDKAEAGQFSFQVTLHKSGDIVFVYKDIPILVEKIEDSQHPVKVGLSDAYIIDKTVFYVRRKTIYEYHRVAFKREDIRNWTVIYMSALPTCVDLKDCQSCLSLKVNFVCKWCPEVNRCSTGFDRYRQDWVDRECDRSQVNLISECNKSSSSPSLRGGGSADDKGRTSRLPGLPSQDRRSEDNDESKDLSGAQNSAQKTTIEKESSGGYATSMLGIVLTIAVISGAALWVLYAYRNPHTPSGQVLIKYRPSQWSLRRGEARYTAATIHM